LVVNDKWILNQKTPDTYTFLLQITASEATCNESALPEQDDDYFTISYGTNIALISFVNGIFTPIDPVTSGGARSLATIGGAFPATPANGEATDVAKAVTKTASPNIYFIPYINSGETGANVNLYFVQATDTPNTHFVPVSGSAVALPGPNWNAGDTPMAIASNGGNLPGTPIVYILAQNGANWFVYDYTITALGTVPAVTFGARTALTGVAGLPNFSRFIGITFVGSDYYLSWVDSNGVSHITGFVAGGGLLAGPGMNTELPMYGLVSDGNAGYLGLAWTSANAALVHETPNTFGPGAGDTRYSVDGIMPFGGGGDPRGIDLLAAVVIEEPVACGASIFPTCDGWCSAGGTCIGAGGECFCAYA